MRLAARIYTPDGVVNRVTVRVEYDGDNTDSGVDITDVQFQLGDPTGVVPHPADVSIRPGARQYRNGVVTASTDEVIVMSNSDMPSPLQINVTPDRGGNIRIGGFRFGFVNRSATVNGGIGETSQGWGIPPMITERSDGHLPVVIDRPTHVIVDWSYRT